MQMQRFKVGFFADGIWGHETFRLLLADSSVEVAFVCVRWDSEDAVLREMAEKHDIPCIKHCNINLEPFINSARQYKCDLFVSMSFNQIFKLEIINLPQHKTINCHAGKLPFYRGRNILNWVLINDEREFGITVHYVDKGIDTGDIILQQVYPIDDSDTYQTLLEKAHHECAHLLYQAISQIQNGQVRITKQTDIHPVGLYCGQRRAGDELIVWNQSSRDLFNFIRAICRPGPMARGFLNGSEMRINSSEMIKNAPVYKGIVGQIVGKTSTAFVVKTLDTTLCVTEYEYDGKIRVGDRFTINSLSQTSS